MRRIGLAVLITALVVTACGRQVTFPKSGANGGLSAGFMSVRFTVAAQFAFSTYDYIIVFNTTGNGITPLPNGGAQSNYSGFSDAIVVSGNSSGAANAVPVQFVSNGTSQAPTVLPLSIPPQDLQFNVNSNSLGTQFEVEFDRAAFSSLVSPSPGASPIPSSTTWKSNCFVTSQGSAGQQFGGGSGSYTPVDSLGIGGGIDTSYAAPDMNTTIAFDETQEAGAQNAPTQSAAIVSCEFANTP